MVKKKIAIIYPKDSSAIFDKKSTETFGGATVQMFLLANEFSNYTDVEVSSLVTDFGQNDECIIEGLKLHKTFNTNDNLLIKIIKFHRAIRKVKPDVIIQHGLTIFSSLLAVYCKVFRIKFVYMFAHDAETDGYYQTNRKKAHLFKLLVNYADVLVTQNKYQYNKIMTTHNKKTNILYNGFPVVKSFPYYREHILWVARCEKWKVPEKYIKLAFSNNQYKFVMVCNEGSNQEYYSDIRQSVHGVKNLDFLSHVPANEMDAIFQKSLILVNTSDDEGFPQVFIQAAMNKVPIISLNVNPDNFITNHKCGIVCDGNVAFMDQSIQNLLHDYQQLNQLSKNAYNYAIENHDIKKNTKMLYDLIFKESYNE